MHCRSATVSYYRLMLRKHSAPVLGECRAADVEHKDILAFHNKPHRMWTGTSVPRTITRQADQNLRGY